MAEDAKDQKDQPERESTVPLDDFCRTISGAGHGPELIAVFRHREIVAGRNHDTPGRYGSRFAAIERSPTAA